MIQSAAAATESPSPMLQAILKSCAAAALAEPFNIDAN
jgi:hypothetical protein